MTLLRLLIIVSLLIGVELLFPFLQLVLTLNLMQLEFGHLKTLV